MSRLEFPQFAQLPSDIQLVILDYICDRRDPFGINVPDREDFTDIKESSPNTAIALEHWSLLRLVCREWSLWFSTGAIRYFSGKLNQLASNQLLVGMTGLKFLEMRRTPGAVAIEPEALKNLALMISPSVRHLNSASAKLVQLLPKKTSRNLQTINLHCNVWETRITVTLKSVFRTFDSRIKHLHVLYYSITQRHSASWEQALRNSCLEKMTLECYGGYLNFKLPANLKQLNIPKDAPIGSKLLIPVSGTLELINAPNSTLYLNLDMPVLPSLKEMRVKQVLDHSQDYLDNEQLLSSRWPNLETLQVRNPPLPYQSFAQAPFKLPTLRSIRILGQTIPDFIFDLTILPPQLEEFEYTTESIGEISGQPQQEMKHLSKLVICVSDFNLPEGFFNSMPALKELRLSPNECSDFKGIDLEELLPLRHTLIDLNAQVCDIETGILDQFSRLKRLRLAYDGDEPRKLDKLPLSLEKLELNGDFMEGQQLGPLPNLKEFSIGESARISMNLIIGVLRNAPNLQAIGVNGLDVQSLLKGIEVINLERQA